VGVSARVHGAVIYLCGPNIDRIQLLCASNRRSGAQGRAPSLGGESWPPEAETLTYWMFNGSHKFACFFSRPYFSKARAIGMVVVCPSVFPSRMYCD